MYYSDNWTSIHVPAKSGFIAKHGSDILLPVTIRCLDCLRSLRGDDFTNLTSQQLNCKNVHFRTNLTLSAIAAAQLMEILHKNNP